MAPSSFLQIYPVDGAQGASTSTYFRWEDAQDEEEYLLEIGTDPSFAAAASVVSSPLPAGTTETALTAQSLTPSQAYYWRVLARNAGGETLASNGPFSLTTGDPSVVAAMKLNYDGSKTLSDPDYLGTLGHFFYPPGKGPVTLGYAPEKLVIVLMLRGGNQNSLDLDSPLDPAAFLKDHILPRGWFGVEPNYPVFDTSLGEKYDKATAGVALLVQFLRANAVTMNLDPDKLFSYGRSFGGIHSYAVGLKEEHQDPDSPDPVKHFSSRPNFVIPQSSPTALACMAPDLSEELFSYFLPEDVTHGEVAEEKQKHSPYYWLLHPEEYSRPATPPMCLVYHAQEPGVCGQIENPHHGIFGLLMSDALAYYTAGAEPELAEKSMLIDFSYLTDPETYELIALWIEARLAD